MRRGQQAARDRGAVLINALVLVAALAGLAALLMQQTAAATLRHGAAQDAAQLRLYLDGAEVLAVRLLNDDRRRGGPDHVGEPWAAPFSYPADRGRIGGMLADAQGRFNLNWLADDGGPDGPKMAKAFDRLAQGLGLGLPAAAAIRAQLDPETPGGGPMIVPDQLRPGTALSAADIALLMPYITVLPARTPVNINTASVPVLQALLGDLAPSAVQALHASARTRPFDSAEAFVGAALLLIDEEAEISLEAGRFGVSSDYFVLQGAAALDGITLTRDTLIRWQPEAQSFEVAHRRATGR